MLEEIILWTIITGAALYAVHALRRVLKGQGGCCPPRDKQNTPPPQNTIPDLREDRKRKS